ncbi:septal ring lytic transglycosylase RlpA family protein [Deinococcus cellulosilyticus]|uniref:RlpA-like protein double-psi beta-barrel domain-containing protein n=1 Tax=Deinococcus cellulosilyticus (strain DSM 18568 / NBRC 106333 / KACC 11606 / 5516J-15) TaxID=1223518 RepID=A0A511N602_DEIC1|nr:septal ring lytic transglycosylase RlpA family protein [Deinococcus cellulosilyticus]GEM48290.1 hypothetical protein DC3_39250 [Deinococcus cellulosilyticus NBRC 106333 = KACC 11606]
MKYLLAILLLVVPMMGMAQTQALQTGYAVYYGGLKDKETPLTAAHPTLPFGTWVEVKHQKTGKTIRVKINDRGPFGNKQRIIDLSIAAAKALGIISEGVAPVEIRVVSGN